jgi:hypothetical protein
MKHNNNPLIHPKLLNSTYNNNLISTQKHDVGHRSGNLHGNLHNLHNLHNKSSVFGQSKHYKINPSYKKLFVYNICIPIIIIIIICFILKDRKQNAQNSIEGVADADADVNFKYVGNNRISIEELAYRSINKQ